MGQDRSPHQTEPQALPPTGATGNLSEKAQVAGGQAQDPEAGRLLTLEHSASGTSAQTGEDAAEAPTGHPCPALELPPAGPLGCGLEDVPAFCFICLHGKKEEELPEEVPLQRSVPTVGSGWAGQGSDLGPTGPGRPACESLGPLLTTHHHLPVPDSQMSHLSLLSLPHPGPTETFLSSPTVVMSLCSEPSMAPSSHRMK